jgi:hypothetical protein
LRAVTSVVVCESCSFIWRKFFDFHVVFLMCSSLFFS